MMKLFSKHIVNGILFLLLLGVVHQASAQFTVTEDFRGSGSPDIMIGDAAYLTSGVVDPVGAGWLRLTDAVNNSQGYTYINKSFPSTLGVLVDFEYVAWRDNPDGGADGFSVFLFDADYGPENDGTQFNLGGYGGSLGYAPKSDGTNTTDGLRGGYIGIGIDEYGNFANPSDGPKPGGPGERPNSVVLRGPTTSNPSTTNKYLAGVAIDNGLPVNINTSPYPSTRSDDEVDYNTITSIRPDISTFYRRVQVEIIPVTISGVDQYEIVVRWATTYGGSFTELISYLTTDAPPALLKVGFAASTGGSFNYHEIRNLLITTPGNLRVVKKADKDILRSVNKGSNENEVTYTIQVVNDTDAELNNIQFEDQLTDANGNLITPAMFSISGISHSGFLSGTSLPTTSADNHFTGSLNLAANSTGNITVTGTLNEVPYGNVLNNTTKVTPTDILDQDLGNNTSTVSIPVISEKSDLVISQTVDQSCLNTTSGNIFTIDVANMGGLDLDYSSGAPIEVTGTLPASLTISNTSNTGWSYNLSGNTFTFTTTGTSTLSTGISLPPIKYTLTGNSAYTNTVTVHSSAEEPLNDGPNNQSDYVIKPQPTAPTLPTGVTSPITYYMGEVAQPLSATVTSGNTLNWYLSPGGAVSTIPFTPSTTTAGTTSYWVSQTNGHCESGLTEIEVQVVAVPTITGTVYHDNNGLTDNLVDDGSGVNGLTNLWVVAVDQNTNQVVRATAVSQFDGTYTLGLTQNGTYDLILINTTVSPNPGDGAPTASLPSGWENTGEYLGTGVGDDGTVDGQLKSIGFSGSNITNANFGIQQAPIPGQGEITLTNPGAGNTIQIPANTFTNITGVQDVDGTVKEIVITSFPAGLDAIKVGTTVYTSIPAGGIHIEVNDNGNFGEPVYITPSSAGASDVNFDYTVIDNAGQQSNAAGQAIIHLQNSTSIDECFVSLVGDTFNWTVSLSEAGNGNGTNDDGDVYQQTITQPGTNGGFTFDIYKLDNSFNMTINGVNIGTQEIQFQNGTSNYIPAGLTHNIEFEDGTSWQSGGIGGIWSIQGTAGKPALRVYIDRNGIVTLYGSKVSSTDPGYELIPLQPINGLTFNAVNWNTTTTNTIVVTQLIDGTTTMDGYGYGRNIEPCFSVSGTVFNDMNALYDNRIDNGSGVSGLADLKVVSLDGAGMVAAITAVNADGTYTVADLFNNTYQFVLISSTTLPAVGSTPASLSSSLPTDWESTGEYLGTGVGTDGTIDGKLEVTVNGADVSEANFGIRQPLHPVRTNPQLLNPTKGN